MHDFVSSKTTLGPVHMEIKTAVSAKVLYHLGISSTQNQLLGVRKRQVPWCIRLKMARPCLPVDIQNVTYRFVWTHAFSWNYAIFTENILETKTTCLHVDGALFYTYDI